MAELDRYIAGVPCWADTSQPDPDAAAAFYTGLFGWEVENVLAPDGTYLIGRIRGGDVGAVTGINEGEPPFARWNTYIWVDSADETALKAAKAGGTILAEPFDVGPAGRMAVIADPEGAAFCIWEAGTNRGSAIVNEHGSVNFNGLNTRDVEGAKQFYGEVFGWKTGEFDGFTAWTLPAYGDHLELLNPGNRERMAEMGGPKGFEEVVAAITPIPADQPDVPAHWSVTFGVDDVDAAVAKATELGGELLVPVIDAPWTRMAVLKDPQGATFIASQFVPENKDVAAKEAAAAA